MRIEMKTHHWWDLTLSGFSIPSIIVNHINVIWKREFWMKNPIYSIPTTCTIFQMCANLPMKGHHFINWPSRFFAHSPLKTTYLLCKIRKGEFKITFTVIENKKNEGKIQFWLQLVAEKKEKKYNTIWNKSKHFKKLVAPI